MRPYEIKACAGRYSIELQLKDPVVCVLAFGAMIACCVGTSAQATGSSTPSGCVGLPTIGCVIDLAIDAADATADAHDRAAALARIAEVQTEAGDDEAARQSLSRALTAAAAIDESSFDCEAVVMGLPEDEAGLAHAQALSGIARVLAMLGEAESAEATFLARRNYRRQKQLRATAIGRKASPLSRQRSWQRARWLRPDRLLRAPVSLTTPSTCPVSIASCGCRPRPGDLDGALATARRIDREDDRGRALAAIADVQADAGDATGALATADRIEHPYYRMVAMHYIGTARARSGDITGAWESVRAIGEIWHQDREGEAGSRDSVILQEDTMGAIVDAHIAAGEIEGALAATIEMTDAFTFVEAQTAIARAQTAAGDLDAAQVSTDEVCGSHHRYAGRWSLRRAAVRPCRRTRVCEPSPKLERESVLGPGRLPSRSFTMTSVPAPSSRFMRRGLKWATVRVRNGPSLQA